MKFEYIVVYENSLLSSFLGIVKSRSGVTVGLQNVFLFSSIQSTRSYNSTLVRARKLILSIYVHRIILYKIHEYRHAC